MGKQVTRLNEAQLHKVIEEATIRILRENKCNEGWIKNMFGATVITEDRINEVTSDVLRRAADKAQFDMTHTNDCRLMRKRDRQYKAFSDELYKRELEGKDGVCPYVPESELKNLPKDTYVLMNGDGRDYYGNFKYSYSGRAGTKEQCTTFANTYYDKDANWEFLPKIVSLDEYFKYYAR